MCIGVLIAWHMPSYIVYKDVYLSKVAHSLIDRFF